MEVIPWMLELLADGAGRTTLAEDTTKEMVSMRSRSKAKAKAKEKARESVTTAVRLDITQGNAPIPKRAKARAKVSRENVTAAGRRVTLQESAPRAKKEESPKGKERGTKAKAKEPGVGERVSGQLTEKRQEIGNGSSQMKKTSREHCVGWKRHDGKNQRRRGGV